MADTHVLLRSANAPDMLSDAVTAILSDPENTIFASAVSAYEIAKKYKLGKLPEAAIAMTNYSLWLENLRFTHLSLTTNDCVTAGSFAMEHRDPWDRMLAAQALHHGLIILSADTKLDLFGVERIW